MGWIIIGIIDNIVKSFQYAWFILIPIILAIIFFLIKKKKLNNVKERKNISKVICILIIVIFVAMFTVRIWGPSFYKTIISFSISGKEKVIEHKLEKKYGKNFNYISQGEIVIKEYAGDSLGQDINDDYSVRYIFEDDDGVIAIVEYKKNYQSDYYESKRSKYDIEKLVYDYSEKVKFDKKFYVYVESPYELINNSNLNEKSRDNFIREERNHDRMIFILTESSDENQNFIVSALKTIFDRDNYFSVYEYVVTEDEYERAISFYNSINSQNGIATHDYEESFDFDKSNQVQFKYYYIR